MQYQLNERLTGCIIRDYILKIVSHITKTVNLEIKIMKIFALMASALFFATFLGGCASRTSQEELARDIRKHDEVMAAAVADQEKRQQKRAESYLDAVPKWAQEPAQPDAVGLYSLGTSNSDDSSFAIKKATLDAEFGLAKQWQQELSGSERSYQRDAGQGRSVSQYTAVIDKLVARVPVIGHEVLRQEVRAIHGKYHAWVLLRLPYPEFNRALHAQSSVATDASAKAAFEDLERRVEARQRERALAPVAVAQDAVSPKAP